MSFSNLRSQAHDGRISCIFFFSFGAFCKFQTISSHENKQTSQLIHAPFDCSTYCTVTNLEFVPNRYTFISYFFARSLSLSFRLTFIEYSHRSIAFFDPLHSIAMHQLTRRMVWAQHTSGWWYIDARTVHARQH